MFHCARLLNSFMICSIKDVPSDFDPQAYGRSCALQQAEMLTRLAEMSMQPAESSGARALAAEAPEAPAGPAGDPGLAFVRYAHLVRQTVAQRARAVQDMCARDGGGEARRERHRQQVETMIDSMVWGDVEDRDRAAALDMQVNQAFADLYGDREDPVEDRPVSSVVAGLVCGLGLARKWRRRARHRVSRPRPGRPGGSAEEIGAERNRRRAAVTARIEQAIDELAEPALAADIRAGLAVRLQEPDVERLIDTESTATAVVRLCRSLGFDIEGNLDIPLDPAVPPDSS
jgi:hypothetical protein